MELLYHESENTEKEEKQISEEERLKIRQYTAQIFAKALAQQVIHDPTGQTSRRASRTYTTYDKASLEDYLASPTTNESTLRNASIYLYQTNGRYRNLLQYFANVPAWVYTINAVNFNPDKVKAENFKKQYLKVSNILESMKIVKTMREISVVALREGVFYGVIWGGDGNSFILQKLEPDNCAITSITDGGVFRFTYDMSKIKEADLETHYPPEFATMWKEYQKTGNQYQVVPPEISVCLKADPTVPEYSIPPFSAILPGLYTIKSMEELFETATELSNYKLLAGKIPVDDDGVPLVEYQTVMQYYTHIANNVGERVGVALSPFELKSYDFEQSGTTSQIDSVGRATDNFFSSAGTPPVLHGTSNSTSGVTKLSVKVDEAVAFGLMYQCETVINRFLKTLSGTQKFKISFLPVSIFNRDEMLSKYKEALNYGIGKLQYLVTLGIPQHDILNQAYIENNILDLNNVFVPMDTASTQSSDGKTGRPVSSDEEIDDAGVATRDNDGNDNR